MEPTLAATPAKQARNALQKYIQIAWLVFSGISYFGGMRVGSKFEPIVETIWAWNVLAALSDGTRLPYDQRGTDFYNFEVIGLVFYWLIPALYMWVAVTILRALDMNSGLTLLERLRKLFIK